MFKFAQIRRISYITKSIENQVCTLKLNSKPVNALDTPLLKQLHSELLELHNDKNIKGLIFGSSLPKVLSAGLDLKTLVDHPDYFLPDEFRKNNNPNYLADYRKHIHQYMGLFQECVKLLVTVPMPSVAVVQGAAPAGGTVLALSCDRRVGSQKGFSMGLTEVFVGMAPPMWVHELARNAIGRRNAAVAIQRGLMYNQDESLALGYVDRLVKEDELWTAALEEIEMYRKLPWIARLDAKMKSVENVVGEINEPGLGAVVDSISGDEFQGVVKNLLRSLANKKK
ncbi:ClpP/crotonase-like domain-containing protein [Globomyces pollinis-pini]|nr:ClpP/crotonase-like domain-containing protein [Globomyces pollinis-pini]